MSAKILAVLDRGEFRRESQAFKCAVLDTALRLGLIAYDPARDFFLNAQTGAILLGLLPDPDGEWRALDPPA